MLKGQHQHSKSQHFLYWRKKLTYISSHASPRISSHHYTSLKNESKSCGTLCRLHHLDCFFLKTIKLRKTRKLDNDEYEVQITQRIVDYQSTECKCPRKNNQTHISSIRNLEWWRTQDAITQLRGLPLEWGSRFKSTKIDLHHWKPLTAIIDKSDMFHSVILINLGRQTNWVIIRELN